jgi:predicted TIM-barrel fold metal-dependent hydrolase
MRDGALPEYNRKRWEPLWAICDELRMPLVTHVGAGTNARYSGLEGVALLQIESGGFTSRRAIWWLIFAGVFERHPGLKFVITETPGNWFPSTAAELDAVWAFYDAKRDEPLNQALLEQVPRPPSEYMANNVYYGASFASPFEVSQAVANCNGTQLLWGSDDPHLEGTFVNPEDRGQPSVTRLALRHTFCGLSAEDTRRMVGQNAIDVYGLDAGALQAVAHEIGAPTLAELATPIDAVPAGASLTAFRSGAGGWG